MNHRELREMCLNAINKTERFSKVAVDGNNTIEFQYRKKMYYLFFRNECTTMARLCYFEEGFFSDDESTLDSYRQINEINGDTDNVNVYLNELRREVVFTAQVRVGSENIFLRSLKKQLRMIRKKVEYFQGDYVDELVDELPCVSCRYHSMNGYEDLCSRGKIPAHYIVKSNQCDDFRDWSGGFHLPGITGIFS